MTAATPSGPSTRAAYDDLTSPREMHADCQAVGRVLQLDRVARAAARPAPSIRFEDHPTDQPKRDLEISVAAQRLANALQLHLD